MMRFESFIHIVFYLLLDTCVGQNTSASLRSLRLSVLSGSAVREQRSVAKALL